MVWHRLQDSDTGLCSGGCDHRTTPKYLNPTYHVPVAFPSSDVQN